ncbi:threonine synthase [Bacillus spongiae]|uniref:Threonine synthase n=1 Tax=Bacillus spongiae TaxID=2683610 RepID=A0ABU8HBA4_9BACI
MKLWRGILQEYRSFLPITDNTPMLSLQEGNTPLIKLTRLSERLEIDLYAKLEGSNPTSSFKDRGMVVAVAKAKESGSNTVICASTGNTSASASAYAARMGMRCIVVIPAGKVAQGKLAQASMYGAEIITIHGNFDEALQLVQMFNELDSVTLVNSLNPFRLEGQKTGAYEICEQLGCAPDIVALPVGNAGNITSYWKGFCEYEKVKNTGLPKMIGFEAEGAAAIVEDRIITNPETIATAIRIGNPANWTYALEAVTASGGTIDVVSDEEILSAYRLLAGSEGIFAEPASCASLAGVLKLHAKKKLPAGKRVVLVLTGNGLKDPAVAKIAKESKRTQLPQHRQQAIDYIRGMVGE